MVVLSSASAAGSRHIRRQRSFHSCNGLHDRRATTAASTPAALMLPTVLRLIGLRLIALCRLPAIAANRLLDELREGGLSLIHI